MTTARKKSKTPSHLEGAIDYQIGIRELRQDASRVIALVENGASITITRHGKVVATINPPQQNKLDVLIARGATPPKTKKLDLRSWKVKAVPAPIEVIDAIHKDLKESRY
jgi:antitoxin (DNA-binding transcriptional repressor) of toxin-antitoxin stability system